MTSGSRNSERPCVHKRVHHEHGDRKRYTEDRCRCAPCRAANTAYARLCYRNQVLGVTARRWLPAAPVAEHVRRLREQGMGARRIADVAGLSRGQIQSLIDGRPYRGTQPQQRIRYDVAERLLAVRLDVADGARVPARGVRRRVEALNALGWSTQKLARLLGMDQTNLSRAVHGDQVVASTHRAVAALYDRMWDQRPTPVGHHQLISVNRTLNAARRNGYLPPLAWDDIDLDDTPPRTDCTDVVLVDPVVVDRLVAGQRPQTVSRVELLAAVQRLHDAGLNDREIGDRVGMLANSVGQLRHRTDARELARLIHLGVALDAAATLTERRSA